MHTSERIATHECGHAQIAKATGIGLEFVTIIPDTLKRTAGFVRLAKNCISRPLHEFSAFELHDIVSTAPVRDHYIIRTATFFYARTVVAVAATSAECLFYPDQEPMEAGGDDDAAITVANRIAPNRPVHFLWCARRDARRLVRMHRLKIQLLAEALLTYRTLSSDEVEAVIAGRFDRKRQQWAATIASAGHFAAAHGTMQRLQI